MDELIAHLGGLVKKIEDYEIVEKLRAGGFATVFIAKKKNTGEIYAAKDINAKGKKMADDQMILREIEIFAKIKGPGILPFHGISLTNFEGEPYPTIFTKYMKNGSLGEMLRQEKLRKAPTEWNNTKKMINIYGICVAMAFIHKNNVIHRDLKPDNILLDENCYPFLSDFGMSKLVDSTSNVKTMNGGTPAFMAPEIYTNSPYNSKVDVYAFGMLLYQTICAKEPFAEFKKNTFMIWHKILSDQRPPLTDAFPESFKELIKKCWAGDMNARPSFEEIVKLLDTGSVMLPDVNIEEFEEYKKLVLQTSNE
ncbi:hypothetical protein TRFO_19060 [Tritrichomonas foetus]|uniref:Protein kinase domain-containing protein n=1 Tax=Tritrichomonas foetus TaxID=1144522 RepID=A0A1J4KJB4_9EUKA|nr:hypothetical protein TRFO_19060 [Tritrichomonas foetus]|eukprot:OHT11431.1 hypothetical protein TRFO_19060 [Tritrichomonas foetus]